MKLWHDDIRRAPDETWYWARTNREAVRFLIDCADQKAVVTEASFDHDMGLENNDPDDVSAMIAKGSSPEGDGVDLAYTLYYLKLAPLRVTIHSWNDHGASRMASILREAGSDVTIEPHRPDRMDDRTFAAMFPNWPK